ncbi:hypothetical protein ACKP2L_05215 [Oenococcus alcoholitolerans]|uniref:hypothetical protein n=1 Tax=Oenococcus alcoholitolerans TaxID=931074 RepID=UPI003F6F2D17
MATTKKGSTNQVGSFFRKIMDKDGPFKDWDQQLNNAISKHHIQSMSRETSKLALSIHSYYTLVNGYQRALESQPNSEIFRDGFSLEKISEIQTNETFFCSDLLLSILSFEKRFKNLIQYYVSKCIGTKTVDYLDLYKYQNYHLYDPSQTIDRKRITDKLKQYANAKFHPSE